MLRLPTFVLLCFSVQPSPGRAERVGGGSKPADAIEVRPYLMCQRHAGVSLEGTFLCSLGEYVQLGPGVIGFLLILC